MVGSQLLCAKSKGGLIFYRARYIEHSSSTLAILFIKKILSTKCRQIRRSKKFCVYIESIFSNLIYK